MSNSDIVFCGTYSRGLENFVQDYLLKNESLLIIDHTFEGRVYFRYSASYDRNSLQKLKYFERLFFNVHYESIRRRVLTKSEHLGLIKNTFVKRLDDLKRLLHILLSLKSKSIVDDNDVGFRISCKINGRMKNRIDSKRLSQELSIILRKSMHLIANLKRPDVEVSLKLNDEGFFIGLPVFDQPLSIRSYMDPDGLRSPICDAMVSLLDRTYRFILDPFCGTGNLVREAALELTAVVIGMDSDCYSVEKSQRQNTKGKYKAEYAEFLFKTALPFRNGQFDAILTDLPFGQKFVCQSADGRGTEMDIALFYERICRESLRLLDRGGRAIFLTARNLRQTLASAAEKAYDSKKKFAVSQYYDVSLGTNEACIVLFNVVYE